MENSTSPLQDRQWVERYAKGLTVLGVLGIIITIPYGGISIKEWSGRWHQLGWAGPMMFFRLVSMCLVAFLAISLASFLRYVLGTRRQQGWILRSTEKVLYIIAGLQLLESVFFVLRSASHFVPRMGWGGLAISLAGHMVLEIIIALMWVALGLVLRRVMPIIDESRTLV